MSEETKKFSLREIIAALLNEIKDAVKQYLEETEGALKKRLHKLLLTGIIGTILLALIITFVAAASLFLLIGSLTYLKMYVPAWQAWDIMGLIGGIVGGALFLVLFLILRKQMSSEKQK